MVRVPAQEMRIAQGNRNTWSAGHFLMRFRASAPPLPAPAPLLLARSNLIVGRGAFERTAVQRDRLG